MTKENMPKYIFLGVLLSISAAAFWDIYIKINEKIWPALKASCTAIVVSDWNSLLLSAIVLLLFWLVVQTALAIISIFIPKRSTSWWDVVFWPFLSETKRPVDPYDDYDHEVLSAKKVFNLTYVGGKTCQTFYLDKYTFCNIRTKDGKMQLITSPNVEIEAAGSKIVLGRPMTLTLK